MISARLLLASVAIVSFATACDLNPQPLPPGEQPDGSANAAAPPGDNAGGGTSSLGGSDGGPSGVGEPPLDGSIDGATDGSFDGGADAALDGEADATLDAADD